MLFRSLVQLPLIKRLREMLEHAADHHLSKDVLLEELAIQCPQEDPKRLLRILVNWGRFADIWGYQSSTASLTVNGSHKDSPPPAA